MKVSIITVVYQNREFLSNAIDSVLGQVYDDIEYIVVDGGSKDGSVELIKAYGDKISKFISESDDGMYDALNKGISMATGEPRVRPWRTPPTKVTSSFSNLCRGPRP